jgi:hypothetical protein
MTRDHDQAGVEYGQAGQKHRGEQPVPSSLSAEGQGHDRRRHHEPDRHGTAVPEEDARRWPGEVVGQEPQAGADQTQRERPEHGIAKADGQHRGAERRERGDGARRTVHVVHEVEGVDQADHPEDGQDIVRERLVEDRPAQSAGEQQRRGPQRSDHAQLRRDRASVV